MTISDYTEKFTQKVQKKQLNYFIPYISVTIVLQVLCDHKNNFFPKLLTLILNKAIVKLQCSPLKERQVGSHGSQKASPLLFFFDRQWLKSVRNFIKLCLRLWPREIAQLMM
jgi:hypothetical protein